VFHAPDSLNQVVFIDNVWKQVSCILSGATVWRLGLVCSACPRKRVGLAVWVGRWRSVPGCTTTSRRESEPEKRATVMLCCSGSPVPGAAGGVGGAAKLVRACGGCLGTRRRKGVEDCDKSGGAVKRALIPEYPSQPGELKHLSTRRKRKKPRFRQ
jgi:hypothetical protein